MPNVLKPNKNHMFLKIFRIEKFRDSKKKLLNFDKSVEAKAERHRREVLEGFWTNLGTTFGTRMGVRSALESRFKKVCTWMSKPGPREQPGAAARRNAQSSRGRLQRGSGSFLRGFLQGQVQHAVRTPRRWWPADSNAPRIPLGRSIARGRSYAAPSSSSAVGVI